VDDECGRNLRQNSPWAVFTELERTELLGIDLETPDGTGV